MKTSFQVYLGLMVFLPSLTVAMANETSPTAFQYFQQGDFEKAVQVWEEIWFSKEKCIELDTDNFVLTKEIDDLVLLAKAYQYLGQLQKALSLLKPFINQTDIANKLFTHDPVGYANILKQLSEVYLAMGDLAEEDLIIGTSPCEKWLKNKLKQPEIRSRTNLLPDKKSTLNIQNVKAKNIVNALRYIQAAEASLAKTNDEQFLANILNTKGNIWAVAAQEKKSIVEELKEQQENNNKPLFMNRSINLIQDIQEALLDSPLKTALAAYRNSVNLAKDEVLKAKALVNLVKIQVNCEPETLTNQPYDACLKPEEENIGYLGCYQQSTAVSVQNDFKNALQQVCQLSNDSYEKAVALIELAPILQSSSFEILSAHCPMLSSEPNQFIQAKPILEKALDIATKLKNKTLVAYAEIYLAQIYAKAAQDCDPKTSKATPRCNKKQIYENAIQRLEKTIHSLLGWPKFQRYSNNSSEPIQITSNTESFFVPERYKVPLPDYLQEQNTKPSGELGTKKYALHSPLVLKDNHPELLAILTWQLGKFFNAQGKLQKAINAYREAVEYTELFRSRCHLVSQPFRQKTEQLYFELADLLLQQAAQQENINAKEKLLTEARDTIELLKKAELQNYFQDECILARKNNIQKVTQQLPQNTAILYPIILPQRIELLLNLPDGRIKQFTDNSAKCNEVIEEANQFREKLQTTNKTEWYNFYKKEYLEYAENLYNWLINPIIKDLKKEKAITTLVIIPQGILYTIPFSALHDGKKYLIEQYAIAVIPGWNFAESQHLETQKNPALLGGSEKFKAKEIRKLEYVLAELNKIKGVLDIKENNLLTDTNFNVPEVVSRLESTLYPIIHFSTHAQFDRNLHNTFIYFYDQKVTMNFLEAALVRQNNQVKLLTLSACQTAVGDERAALGLAGSAIKLEVDSVLATLWELNDKVGSDIMPIFYQQWLKNNSRLSKAQALQATQIEILKEPETNYPHYWAPLILIGNWE